MAPRRQLRELEQGPIGLIGLVLTVFLLVFALNFAALRNALFGTEYTAQFAEAGGLRTGDEVRVSGLKIGTVERVELDGTKVKVSFDAEGIRLGDRSRAAVKSNNALGAKFLAVEPGGEGSTSHIPLDRTDPGFRVNERLGQLTANNAELNVGQVSRSLESLTKILAATPEEFRGALSGVGDLSESISSRNEALSALLKRTSGVSGVLADRTVQITDIMSDGSDLLNELESRKDVLEQLLANIVQAAEQLKGLAEDNKTTLKPVLQELTTAVALLNKHRDALEFAIKNLGGFARGLGEGVGSGPFFTAYLQNLAASNFVPVDTAPIIGELLGAAQP